MGIRKLVLSFVLSLSLDEYEQGRQTFRWLMGGLEARTWTEVMIVCPTTLLGSAIVIASSRELDALLLGDLSQLEKLMPVLHFDTSITNEVVLLVIS